MNSSKKNWETERFLHKTKHVVLNKNKSFHLTIAKQFWLLCIKMFLFDNKSEHLLILSNFSASNCKLFVLDIFCFYRKINHRDSSRKRPEPTN